MKSLAQSILSVLFLLAISTSAAFASDEQVAKSGTKSSVLNCSSSATSTFQSNVFQNSMGRVSVIILKEDQQPVTLQVLNNDNQVLFSKTIMEDSVRQNLCMRELDPGMYKVTVSKNGECFTKTVTVK
jgi:hypothetical protein